MKTACCDYQCKDDDHGPVFTNTGNNVVQCHNCGEVYVKISDLTALREQMAAAKEAVDAWPAPAHGFYCGYWRGPDGYDSRLCDCDVEQRKGDRTHARRKVGLEERK